MTDGQKKVFVIGATGVLGRPAVRGLVEAGYQVTGMARSPEKAALLQTLGATPVELDLFDPEAVVRAVDGHEIVIHMATHIPPMSKMALPNSFAENDRLRREGTPILVDAARRVGAKAVIKESITFSYPDLGDQWIDEDTPVEAGTVTDAALVAEEATLAFTGEGRRGIALRFGSFYGPEASHTLDTIRMARRHVATTVGPADAYMSSIHTDDAATAVVAAVTAPAGLYNVVDDEPMTRRENFAALADAFGIKMPKLPGAAIAKLGGRRSAPMARSQRVANGRFKAATGWSPAYPSAREGYAAIASALALEETASGRA